MHPLDVYQRLLAAYGPQHWWPADTPFEMMVGAILTQNTAWTNVEKAIAAMKSADALDARRILDMDASRLAGLIRPSGYFNQKAARLKGFSAFYLEHDGEAGIASLPDPRAALLALNGIGPETADSILLYALHIPVFVVDAYTRRIFARLGLTNPDASYAGLQGFFHRQLEPDAPLFNEYHALIVHHAKRHCRSSPDCACCPLRRRCRDSTPSE